MAEAEGVTQVARACSITLGGLTMGLAVFVIREYARLVWDKRGALPVHVTLIACSYVIIRMSGLIAQVELLAGDSPATFRLVTYPIADALGFVALTVILRDIGRRAS